MTEERMIRVNNDQYRYMLILNLREHFLPGMETFDKLEPIPPKNFLPWCCDKDGTCNAVYYMSETNSKWRPKCWNDCPYRKKE